MNREGVFKRIFPLGASHSEQKLRSLGLHTPQEEEEVCAHTRMASRPEAHGKPTEAMLPSLRQKCLRKSPKAHPYCDKCLQTSSHKLHAIKTEPTDNPPPQSPLVSSKALNTRTSWGHCTSKPQQGYSPVQDEELMWLQNKSFCL